MEKEKVLKQAYDEAGNNMAVAALSRKEAIYVMRLIMRTIVEKEHAQITDEEIGAYVDQHLKEEDIALRDFSVDPKLYRF